MPASAPARFHQQIRDRTTSSPSTASLVRRERGVIRRAVPRCNPATWFSRLRPIRTSVADSDASRDRRPGSREIRHATARPPASSSPSRIDRGRSVTIRRPPRDELNARDLGRPSARAGRTNPGPCGSAYGQRVADCATAGLDRARASTVGSRPADRGCPGRWIAVVRPRDRGVGRPSPTAGSRCGRTRLRGRDGPSALRQAGAGRPGSGLRTSRTERRLVGRAGGVPTPHAVRPVPVGVGVGASDVGSRSGGGGLLDRDHDAMPRRGGSSIAARHCSAIRLRPSTSTPPGR